MGSSGGVPTILGETGIAFDLDQRAAFASNDLSMQTVALDSILQALDGALLSFTLWNYTPQNTNEVRSQPRPRRLVTTVFELELRLPVTKSIHEIHSRDSRDLGPAHSLSLSPSLIIAQRGDLWNDEDLSIFSRDQMNASSKDPVYNGGRALPAVVRPYARKVAGTPLNMHFDLQSRIFTFSFRSEQMKIREAATEIFVPLYQYPDGINFDLSRGLKLMYYSESSQTLAFSHNGPGVVHYITVRPREFESTPRRVNLA